MPCTDFNQIFNEGLKIHFNPDTYTEHKYFCTCLKWYNLRNLYIKLENDKLKANSFDEFAIPKTENK